MRENTDQNNSEYGHFLRSDDNTMMQRFRKKIYITFKKFKIIHLTLV